MRRNRATLNEQLPTSISFPATNESSTSRNLGNLKTAKEESPSKQQAGEVEVGLSRVHTVAVGCRPEVLRGRVGGGSLAGAVGLLLLDTPTPIYGILLRTDPTRANRVSRGHTVHPTHGQRQPTFLVRFKQPAGCPWRTSFQRTPHRPSYCTSTPCSPPRRHICSCAGWALLPV